MSIQTLLVEDNPHKRNCIIEYLATLGLDVVIDEVWSFNSAVRALANKRYSIVVLDMSLPTFDKTEATSSGKMRQLGGRELARRIIRRQPDVQFIFVTQYLSFSESSRSYSFDTLKYELAKECGEHMLGMIYFDNSKTSWKEELGKLMQKVAHENSNR